MDKAEALKALQHGKKLTHRWFTSEEWIESVDGRASTYRFEDGCICNDAEFWKFRSDESWDNGWSIFNETVL